MSSEARQISQLLQRWEEARERGEDPTPEELCRDCPELLETFRRLIRDIGGSEDTVAPDSLSFSTRPPEDLAPAIEAADDSQPQRRLEENSASHSPHVDQDGESQKKGFALGDGRYLVEAKLGKGGFGAVYLAFDRDLKRQVAVKTPTALSMGGEDRVEAFLREARTAAKLKHPGIVGVYDVSVDSQGQPLVVMEYIEGKSLESLLEEELPYSGAAEITVMIADALAYAHREGVYHRDLKPANVLIDHQGEPHIVDFGLALHEDEQYLRSHQTEGTPSYMSPEQVRGESHQLDGRADIWALGVIFYRMLLGRLPFRGRTFGAVAEQILRREPKPPRQIDDKVPEELEAVFTRCCQKEIADRYSTAADVAADVRAWLAASEEKPQAWLNRQLVTAALAGLCLLAVGGWWLMPAGPEAGVESGEGVYVEAHDPDPTNYMVSKEKANEAPRVPPAQVVFKIRNLSRIEIEVMMVNCASHWASQDPDFDPWGDIPIGTVFTVRIPPDRSIHRQNLSGSGWYVFFVRRVDSTQWHPYRKYSSDTGARNVCNSENLLLTISDSSEKGIPYVWTFEESDEPIPELDAFPDEAI